MSVSENNLTQSITYPFNIRELGKGNFFQRMFGIQPKSNALIEFTNLLARSKNIRNVTPDSIAFLNDKYKLDITVSFRQELEEFYRAYVKYCLSESRLTNENVDNILHLKKLFRISDSTHNRIYEEVGEGIYLKSLREALKDCKITDDEKESLKRLSKELELSDEIAENIYRTEAKSLLNDRIEQTTKQEEISPEEENELKLLSENLGVDMPSDDYASRKLARCRLYWQIRYGDLSTVDVDINLKSKEVAYFTGEVDWYEPRRVINRVQFGGPSLRMKIADGFYWNYRDYQINPISQDVISKIDSGRIYLTNKRLIFVGNMKNTAISLNDILDIKVYSDGVGIEKAKGRTPIITLSQGSDIFVKILTRLISESV